MKLLRQRTGPNARRRNAGAHVATGTTNDPEFQTEFDAVSDATMTSPERVEALCEAVDYICRNRISGDVVECGVWKGGSMMAAAARLIKNQNADRTLWAFDTYSGMSKPTAADVDLHGATATELLAVADVNDVRSVWCQSSLDEVRSNLLSTGYAEEKLRFVVGKVEETLNSEISLPEQIALLRLDTDWYESTKVELEQLFPRLVRGGVLIIDDYGHWQGCRRAVDEYFTNNAAPMFLQRIDYTARMGVKICGTQEIPNTDAA